MEKDKIEKNIRNATSIILILSSGYILSLIVVRYGTPKIKFDFEPSLWVGSLILAISVLCISGIFWPKKNTDDDTVGKELNNDIKKNKPNKNRIIQEIITVIFIISTVIFQHIAMGYRPSKVHHVTPEYSFWVLIFWVSLLWTIIYVIIIEIKRNLKRKE